MATMMLVTKLGKFLEMFRGILGTSFRSKLDNEFTCKKKIPQAMCTRAFEILTSLLEIQLIIRPARWTVPPLNSCRREAAKTLEKSRGLRIFIAHLRAQVNEVINAKHSTRPSHGGLEA